MILRGAFKRENSLWLILFAVMFLVGVTAGACISSKAAEDELDAFKADISYSAEQTSNNRIETARESFLSILAFSALIWICGFFALPVKLAAISAVIIYKGLLVGYTVGLLSYAYALKGLGIAAATIIPQYILVIPLMFFLARQAMIFETKRRKNKDLYKYSFNILVFTVFCAAAAFADAYISAAIIRTLFL